jgi:hypothetical protein
MASCSICGAPLSSPGATCPNWRSHPRGGGGGRPRQYGDLGRKRQFSIRIPADVARAMEAEHGSIQAAIDALLVNPTAARMLDGEA